VTGTHIWPGSHDALGTKVPGPPGHASHEFTVVLVPEKQIPLGHLQQPGRGIVVVDVLVVVVLVIVVVGACVVGGAPFAASSFSFATCSTAFSNAAAQSGEIFPLASSFFAVFSRPVSAFPAATTFDFVAFPAWHFVCASVSW
jgi:hypothetical protein